MGIHVSEPGRPQGTRLPDAFRARRVADRGEPEEIARSAGNTERPVDPTRFSHRMPPHAKRALEEYQDDPQDRPESEHAYLPAIKLASSVIVTLDAASRLGQAFDLMEARGISHLVITSNGQTAGLVDKQWVLWQLWKSGAGGQETALETMELPAFITVTPDTDGHELARQMLGYRLTAALVINNNNQPSGIVTSTDFLRLYAEASQFHTAI